MTEIAAGTKVKFADRIPVFGERKIIVLKPGLPQELLNRMPPLEIAVKLGLATETDEIEQYTIGTREIERIGVVGGQVEDRCLVLCNDLHQRIVRADRLTAIPA